MQGLSNPHIKPIQNITITYPEIFTRISEVLTYI